LPETILKKRFMKKIYLSLLLFYSLQLTAQITREQIAESTLACDSVSTLYAYTYLNHGAMFNVVASSAITLDYLSANLKNGTTKYTIYYKTGSFIGFETTPSAWTHIDTATVTSNNTLTVSNQATRIPINLNVSMLSGDTVSFYLKAPNLSFVYLTSTTTPWGTAYSNNSDLSISVARSIYQSFGVPFSTPQIWNGTVSYCPTGTNGVENVSTLATPLFSTSTAGNNLKVTIDEDFFSNNRNLELKVSDIMFRKIKSENVNSSSVLMDISSLSKGVYFCSLMSSSKILFTKMVIVE
jgi:hypothetical protein